MSMHYANNEQNKLIHISQSVRGLECNSTCFVCGTKVIARKGNVNQHHFAHHLPKEDCKIEPESALHKYAKEVIQKYQYIIVPANQVLDSLQEKTRVNFSDVITEQSINSIRPDITGYVANKFQNLYIEIVVTNPPSEEKLKIIQGLKLDTIQIDLQEILTKNIHFPSTRAESYILGATHNKQWLYPIQQKPIVELPSLEIIEDPIIPHTIEQPDRTKFSFKINGMFVNVIQFEDKNISASCAYNPQLIEIFQELRKRYHGFYNKKYKSSNFRYPYSLEVLKLLENLDES